MDDSIASHPPFDTDGSSSNRGSVLPPITLKGCQGYGHRIVSVILSCNRVTLNYTAILHDKSKIQIVQEITEELPTTPIISYFLCDSWYIFAKVIKHFIWKEFFTIEALKTNRILYAYRAIRKPVRLLFTCKKQIRMTPQ